MTVPSRQVTSGNLPISWWAGKVSSLHNLFRLDLLEEKQQSWACLDGEEREVCGLEWESFSSSKCTFELLGAFSKWTWSQSTQRSYPTLGKNIMKSQRPFSACQRMKKKKQNPQKYCKFSLKMSYIIQTSVHYFLHLPNILLISKKHFVCSVLKHFVDLLKFWIFLTYTFK